MKVNGQGDIRDIERTERGALEKMVIVGENLRDLISGVYPRSRDSRDAHCPLGVRIRESHN